jgi:hypothetical protein
MKSYLLCLVSCVIFFSGCGNSTSPSDLPKLYSCKITLTQEGKPLEGATVTMVSKTPSKYGVSSATTNVSGTAVMRTYSFDGVPVGEYGITIEKIGIEDAKEGKTPEGNPIQIGGKIYSYVDASFGDTSNPPFSVTVTEKGTAETFDAGKPVHIFLRDNEE